MSSNIRRLTTRLLETGPHNKWARRRDIPLAILAWTAVAAVIFWAAGHIIRSLLLLIIAALLAYALAPAVRFLQRFMPRILAILIVYLLVLGALSLLIYLVMSTAIVQGLALARYIRQLLTPAANGQPTPLEQTLMSFGLSQAQIAAGREQIIQQIESIAHSVIPILRSVFDFILDTIVVAVLSIYFLIDGARVASWIRANGPAPQQQRVHFLLDTLERIVGGYIRGQLFLAFLIGVLVGVGMVFVQPGYAVLLGVLAFVLAFVPVLGTFVSGAACVLLALPRGWIWAVGVLGYFVLIHIFEGEVVGPRIVGKAIGLHPIVSLTALIAGAELFGIWGALFASPLAGILQAMLVAVWKEWRATHPEQFLEPQEEVYEVIEENVADKPLDPPDTMTSPTSLKQ
jgi:predicted PurR-regulated permease PerM